MTTSFRKLPMPRGGPDFAALLGRNDSALRRYIMSFFPSRDDVEEVLQRTAVILWEKHHEYDADRSFLPWACRFAYFEVLNYRKELARSRVVYSIDAIEAIASARDQLEAELDLRSTFLDDCLGNLNNGDRALLERRYCESQTVRSLAEESGKTAKALYRRLDRIRATLLECVDRKFAMSNG